MVRKTDWRELHKVEDEYVSFRCPLCGEQVSTDLMVYWYVIYDDKDVPTGEVETRVLTLSESEVHRCAKP